MTTGIIFDFDDTLIETTKHFDAAKEKFRIIMDGLGFPAEESLVTLNQFDIKNVIKYGGFMIDCFPKALLETYEFYCRKYNRDICTDTRYQIENLGWQVFEQKVEEIHGAQEVLTTLYNRYPLYLATKGEPQLQLAKLKNSGLEKFFQQVYVTPDKTPREYLDIAREHKLKVLDSWVVGNSMKGDINPAIKSGFKCIHVYHHHTWDYEDEAAVGEHHSVTSLHEILDIIL